MAARVVGRRATGTVIRMPDRTSASNLAASLGLFAVIMLLVLVVLGGGVGTVELVLWFAILAFGVALLVHRHRAAQRDADPGAR